MLSIYWPMWNYTVCTLLDRPLIHKATSFGIQEVFLYRQRVGSWSVFTNSSPELLGRSAQPTETILQTCCVCHARFCLDTESTLSVPATFCETPTSQKEALQSWKQQRNFFFLHCRSTRMESSSPPMACLWTVRECRFPWPKLTPQLASLPALLLE